MGGIVKTDFCYQVGLLTQSRLKHTLTEKMESGEVQIPNIKPIDRIGGWDKGEFMLMGAMG